MARKKSKAPEAPTAPGWMTTYGDLMSLLLVFFILLVSFSTMEIVKFRQAMGSLRGGEGEETERYQVPRSVESEVAGG